MLKNKLLLTGGFWLLMLGLPLWAGETQWIAVGDLHDWFHSAGAEQEVGRTFQVSDQQDGLRWNAQFRYQDTKAAKALWLGVKNYNDAVAGKTYNYKVVHAGPRVLDESNEFMTETFELWGKYGTPQVFVDNAPASKLSFLERLKDENVDPELIADRMIYNVVRTSIGVKMKRTIYGFTSKKHKNYFITEYVFINDGIIDLNGTSHPQTLEDFMVFFQYRYAPTREGGPYGYYWLPQATSWGQSTMNDVIYSHPQTGEPFRALISWLGKHSGWQGPGDNIGGPAYDSDGHFGAPQFVGVVDLHADKSPSDPTDDINQPFTTQEVESDADINYGNSQYNESQMAQEYAAMIAGRPALSHAARVGDGNADNYAETAGGSSQAQGFGPYTLEVGDSIRIVVAEAVAGLDRESCYVLGKQWLDNAAPFTLPGGGSTNDRNEFKNAWVMTGYDSLVQTFDLAKANFESDFTIPEPPPPPEQFTVSSGGDRIFLNWSDNADGWSGTNFSNKFNGYRVYRAIFQNDTTYQKIFECGPGTDHPEVVHSFEDKTARRGFDYYYYVTSFDDGSTPDGVQESSKFYTMTQNPAHLLRPPGNSLSAIRIVPNPYNIKAREWQFGLSGGDRINFYNLPPQCDIKIFTERGDLIKTIHHTDNSGDESWNSNTSSNQVIVSGIYIVYFEVTQDYVDESTGKVIFKKGDSIAKKLAVVR
ncbi:MAG: hypothetical protein D6677_13860 [Calditrichaeota bacterium]|nr:MAG: hypothetical protein D6677_13860 [Calditrichota bacterium]